MKKWSREVRMSSRFFVGLALFCLLWLSGAGYLLFLGLQALGLAMPLVNYCFTAAGVLLCMLRLWLFVFEPEKLEVGFAASISAAICAIVALLVFRFLDGNGVMNIFMFILPSAVGGILAAIVDADALIEEFLRRRCSSPATYN
jgi:hypothetical protein